MLQNVKISRPDRLLQKRLIGLAYSLVALTAALILSIVFPQHLILLLGLTAAITVFALALSLLTLKAGEKAISYGGFANEIIRLSSQAKRIDNSLGRVVIENDRAKELFGEGSILAFLQSRLSADNRNNPLAFQRLKNAFQNLSGEKVTLSLKLGSEPENETWFEVILRPLSLKKTDLFENSLALKKIRKDTFLYWSFRDITNEHNLEQIFREERRGLHDFTDDLPVGLYICNRSLTVEYCNHAFAKMLETDRERLIGTDLKELLSPNSPVPPCRKWNKTVHFTDKYGKDKEAFLCQDSFREKNEIKIRGAVVCNLPTDDLLRRQLGLAVDKISWLFDFAPVGIVFINNEGVIRECNRQAEAFLRQADGIELINANLMDFIKKSDRHGLGIELDNIRSGVKKSASMELALIKGPKVALSYVSPMKSLYGSEPTAGFVIYLVDATEQKNLEIKFAQAQKMQAMGQLAGGVAHDFNNLLTAVIGFCDLLLQRHGIGDPSFADLIQIKNNANRAAGLVRQLLAFSRKQPLQPKLIDVTENFMELSQMLKRVLGEKISLKFHHGADLGYIRVDPVQFSQVIINLAVNAKDAMNGSGTLTIITRTEKITHPRPFGEETIKPGEFVVIEVSDTGCGIAEENLSRIFEPFFSTKQNVVGSGTGLGLAMVYGIVRQTEGFIRVDSKVGEGTTFLIHLPRFEHNTDTDGEENAVRRPEVTSADGSPVMTVREQNAASLPINQKFIFGLNVSAIDKNPNDGGLHTGIRILFVEDEDSVRSFAVRALKKKGYEVIGCNSAENALEQLEKERNFQLLVTDMVMPGLNGIELAHRVKELIPGIKIILASGYSEEIARNELSAADRVEFMAKPFSLGDLTKKIFDVLNKE